MNIKEFNELKAKVAKKQSEVDQAKGAYNSGLKDLEKNFGIKTIKEAKALLKQKEKEKEKAEKAFETMAQEFKDTHGDELGI